MARDEGLALGEDGEDGHRRPVVVREGEGERPVCCSSCDVPDRDTGRCELRPFGLAEVARFGLPLAASCTSHVLAVRMLLPSGRLE